MSILKILSGFIFIIVAFCIITYIGVIPSINLLKDYSVQDSIHYEMGDTIYPLSRFNLDEGKWSAYVIINRSDRYKMAKDIPFGSTLCTNDIKLLKQMQAGWHFLYTGGDMATTSSSIILLKNGKQVFKSGIVLDETNQGLQNENYGWIKSIPTKQLSDDCKRFKPYLLPVMF